MIQHVTVVIHGQVQGVGFRYRAQAEAQRLELKGFVKNQADGTVRIEAEGAEERLNEFLAWCRQGPDSADVTKLDISFGEIKGYRDFSIRLNDEPTARLR